MIPLTKKVADLIGEFAEFVDNPGLRYDKFPYAKWWGEGRKVDDAGRWNVLRLSTGGPRVLRLEAAELRHKANGPNTNPDNARKFQENASLLDRLAQIPIPSASLNDVATDNTRRLLADLDRSYPGRVVSLTASLGGRLAINLAGGVIDNAGISLDRCFGLPLIPGIAVKGITRAWALWDIREEADETVKRAKLQKALLIFGCGAQELRGEGVFAWAADREVGSDAQHLFRATDFKGLASFLPAYPTDHVAIVADMVNPHYPNYYRKQGSVPALDAEQPKPNFFPVVEKASNFGFAVVLNRAMPNTAITAQQLQAQLRKWLVGAITNNGLGAKTASGYGWFHDPATAAPASPSAERLRALATMPLAGIDIAGLQARPPGNRSQPHPIRQALQPTRTSSQPSSSGDPLIDKWRGKLDSTGNFPAVLPELAAIADIERLRRVFQSIFPECEQRKLIKRNGYWQSFTSRPQGKAIFDRLGLKLH